MVTGATRPGSIHYPGEGDGLDRISFLAPCFAFSEFAGWGERGGRRRVSLTESKTLGVGLTLQVTLGQVGALRAF